MKVKGLNWAGRSFILPLVIGLLLLASVVKNSIADTSVSGTISSDTTWTKATSPYIVTGSVVVNSGVALTIESGVTVKLDSGKALQIDGTLIAKGTNSEKITFTRNSGDNWGYILFSNSSTDASYDSSGNYTSGSILEYCVVEYAGGVSVSDNGAIRLNNAHPFINYCTIQNNTVSGIHAYNISGTLKISNSTITDNKSSSYGGGVYVHHTSGGVTTISGNTIKGNTVASGYSGGGIYSSSGTVTITNNAISGNVSHYGGGIHSNYGTIKISNNIISGNAANSSYGGGINCNSSTATIINNIISGNTTSSLGGGIYCTYQVTITNNTISSNSANNATAVYYNSSDGKDFKYNTITGNKATSNTNTYAVYVNTYPYFNYNNIYSDSSSYELWFNKSQGSSHLDAKNNWWGSSDDATVQDKIYDFVDDSTKAIVDYSPYATSIHTDCPISPPTGLTATAGTGQITLSWSGNSESDLAGYKVYWDTDSGYPYANSAAVGNTTSYTITGLATGKYYVTVTAYDSSYISATDDQSTVINENQTNGNESWYAEEKTVTVSDSTVISKPTVSTGSATNITSSSATLNGTVTANGASTTAWFQYGKVSGTYDSTSATTSGSGSTETSVSIGISGLSSSATYYYRIAAQNSGGTSYGSETSFTTSVYKDTTKPSGSISIDSGATYTIFTTVPLSLSATDDTGVTGYYLSTSSTTPSASASGWTSVSATTSYSGSISYTLNSGDGTKTIYAWYKDAAGNVSGPASDTITLDTTAPTITITSPTSSSTYTTTSSTISLSGSASDSTSGVSSVTWSSDKDGSGTASGTTSWSISSITLTSSANVITVTATDNAGNTKTATITVTYSPGTTGALSLSKDTAYLSGDTIVATVVDADRNTSASVANTLTTALKVTGKNYSVGTDLNLSLVETGIDSGTFVATFKTGATTNTGVTPQIVKAIQSGILNVIYTDTAPAASSVTKTLSLSSFDATMAFDADSYSLDTYAVVTLADAERNSNYTTAESLLSDVYIQTSSVNSTKVRMVETGADTGTFKGSIQIASSGGTTEFVRIQATEGDSLKITYDDNVNTTGYSRTVIGTATVKSESATKEWVKLIENGVSNGGMAYAYDSNRNRGVIFGGDNSSLNQLSSTYEWNGTSWILITSSGPSSRVNAAIAFDSSRGKSVLFGGWVKPDNYYGDTWTWDGTQWSQVSSTGPQARANQAMAYDSSRGRVVLFGGSYYQTIYGDTWEWDVTSWTQVSSSGPSSRIFARMAYDEARGKVVLFGGQTTYYGTFLNDTWEWDGTSWQQVATTGPSARSWHTMAYDPDRQRVVLFGGGGWGRAESFNDTWEWDGTLWAQADAYGPSARIGASMFYDKTLKAPILFGGYNNGSDYSTLSDTWKYSSTSLSPTPTVIPSPTPSPSPSPTPTTSPLKKGMVYGTVNDTYGDTLEGVTVIIVGEGISDSTETDEDGYYEFQGLAAGDYTLTYEIEGYVTQKQEISLEEGETKELETIMPLMSTNYGYVVNVKGEPINKARLKLKGINTKYVETKYSDGDGYFEFTGLEADTYLIFARKRGYLPKKIRVKLKEGEEKDVGEITLRKNR